MRYFTLAIALAFAMPATVEAQIVTWNENVRGWYIGVDRSVDDGCYMHSEFERGGLLRVGFNPEERSITVLIGNESWMSLENGKLYPIEFQFGRRPAWTVEAGVWEWSDGGKSLEFFIPLGDDATDFITEVKETPNVAVRYEGREILNLSLTGTFAAMEEVLRCQSSMLQNTNSSSDPFSSGSGSVSDPFR